MASTTLQERQGPGLQVGSVISRGVSLWGRLILPFALIYLLQVLPQIALATSTPAHVRNGLGLGAPIIIATILGGLISLVTHGACYVSASQVIDGGKVDVMAAIRAAMSRFFPLLGTWFLAGLLFVLGFILLVVPGVIALLALFVAGPVCVLEGLGSPASLRRSAALTKGQRWRLFAIVLVMAVLGGLATVVVIPARPAIGLPAASVVQAILSSFVGLFDVIVATVVYRDLVDGSEGYGSRRMAAVFD